ncbi:MAG: FHA domain-containing protein [Myxococcota bacterium]|nr:FHA domain-containing protein [Myxococcota bacterium]MDW8362663.1 FHA domain-containing protein [Myxococcales bacterium]
MYKLVISDDEGKTTVVPLVRDEVTVGRKEGNTIRLTERNVSRRHARISKTNGAFVIEDLDSYNGVKVNGRRIERRATLKAGDRITIGDYQLSLQLDGAQAEAAPPFGVVADAQTAMLAAPPDRPPPARLVMLTPPAPGAEFALSRPRTRIGRAEDLDAWINHKSISREHAEVVRDGEALKIRDLGSSNGIRVNGKDVSEAVLQPGDIVELGQVRFRFVGEGEAYHFDADRTVQVEAVGAGTGSRAPVLAAAGIIGVAVAVASVLALSGGDADEPMVPTARPLVTPGAPQPVTGLPGPPSSGPTGPHGASVPEASSEGYEQAVEACRRALVAGRHAEAAAAAEAALGLRRGGPEARECYERAALGRAREAAARGEIEAAYLDLEGTLDETSPLRASPEYAELRDRVARHHVQQARRLERSDPQRAAQHASAVLAMPGVAQELRAAAEDLRRRASRAASAPTTAPGATEARGVGPRSQQPAATTGTGTRGSVATAPVARAPASGSPGESQGAESPGTAGASQRADPLGTCLREPDYNQCVVRNLEGRASTSTPRELAALIEAHRRLGNMPAATRAMEMYVRRFPNDSRSAHYQQLLLRH